MKLLSIVGTVRKKGNSTLASEYIAKKLDAELEIIRLTDLDIKPCKACYACLYGEECKIDDDVIHVYDKISESDKILISSPVYILDATGSLKALMDRQLMAINYIEELSGKDAAVITPHGFGNMRGWASSTHLVLAKVLYLQVLANVEVHAALPGEILTKDENLEKLDRIVESFESGERTVFNNQCPVCLNHIFRVEEEVYCPICGSKLDENLNVVEEGERFKAGWSEDHFKELEKLKEKYIEKASEIQAKVKDVLEKAE